MKSSAQLLKLLTEAIEPKRPLALDKVNEIATKIGRTVEDILHELGVYAISESLWSMFNDDLLKVISEDSPTERKIEVVLLKTGIDDNLYEVIIPVTSNGKKKTLKTYQSFSNTKQEGESDEEATARIIETIREHAKSLISKIMQAKKEGRFADARRILDEFVAPKDASIAAFKEKMELRKKNQSTRPSGMGDMARKSAKSREKFLHSRGLLSRLDVAKSIGVRNEDTLSTFVDEEVKKLVGAFPGWEEMAEVGPPTTEELNEFLPTAKFNIDLTEFMWPKKIDEERLSLDALEAIAAASLAVSAGVKVANKKVEEKYAVR